MRNNCLCRLLTLFLALHASLAYGQRLVTFALPHHAVQIKADLYGSGTNAVILAHGGRFHKESWRKQADVLARSGFLVLAIRFRGDVFNRDGSPSSEGSDENNTDDVLAAVAYLRSSGATRISAVGASLGGDAVGAANARSKPGTFARTILLASAGGDRPEKLHGRKLFLVARDDSSGDGPRLPGISANYAKAPEPKKLVVVEGSAHAQFLFGTEQGPRVLDEIVRFLKAP